MGIRMMPVTRTPPSPTFGGTLVPFSTCCIWLGPVPAHLEHRSDVRVQVLRGRLGEHHLVRARLHGPPSGDDDRPHLRRPVNQRQRAHLARCRRPSVDGDRAGQHPRADLGVGDAGQRGDLAERRGVGRHLSLERARVLQELSDRRVGPARPRQRGEHHCPHHGRDQRQQREAAPVLAQPRPNAQPHRSHLAPTPARTGPVLRFSRPGRLTARGVTRHPADASPTA